MQDAQLEHLKKLINESPVLSRPERGEWADMLTLMNDKQANELETILSSAVVAASPPPVPPPPGNIPPHLPAAQTSAVQTPADKKMPPLTHISNLPSGVAAAVPARAIHLSPADFQKDLKMRLQEKELPPPVQAPPPHRPNSTGSKAKAALENLADVGKLTVLSLRSFDAADLLLRLQQLAKIEGYFNLLAHLEDSPLYKNYIATGKKVLASQAQFGQAADSQSLTKEEFELFADILQKIQIN